MNAESGVLKERGIIRLCGGRVQRVLCSGTTLVPTGVAKLGRHSGMNISGRGLFPRTGEELLCYLIYVFWHHHLRIRVELATVTQIRRGSKKSFI